jgi:hypothetical protein
MAAKRKKKKRSAGKKNPAKKSPKARTAARPNLLQKSVLLRSASVAAPSLQPGDTPIPLEVDYEGPIPSDADITGQGSDAVLNRINNILAGGNGVFIFRNNGDIYVRRV